MSTGGSQGWSTAKTRGKASVEAKTSNYIYSSKVRNCPFADNVGAELRIKKLNGEIVHGKFWFEQR